MRRWTALFLFLPCAAAALRAQGQNCAATTKGFIPLSDLADGTYLGQTGGLYPGGLNHRPAAHDAAGLAQAALVVPRNASGTPDAAAGKIVLLSIGISNTTQEFSKFLQSAMADPERNPKVQLVDGAQGGQSIDSIKSPSANYWTVVDQRLANAGCTPNQVQAVWLKEAYAGPATHNPPLGGFPAWTATMAADLSTIVQIIKDKYPNTVLLYGSTRTYAGYATTNLNPEPWAYESGFAVRKLIEMQLGGDPALNYDLALGAVQAPWIAWGPYLWTDGISPRSDGLVWLCSDTSTADGTHPSSSGQQKVADLLTAFFKSDATARSWYMKTPGASCGPQALWDKYGSGTGGPNGTVQLVASRPPSVPSLGNFRVHAFQAPPGAIGGFGMSTAPLPVGTLNVLGGWVLVQPPLVVHAALADSFGKANWSFGPIPQEASLCGAEVYFQFAAVDPDTSTGFDLSRGLRVRAGH
jgi:hypothetical protein